MGNVLSQYQYAASGRGVLHGSLGRPDNQIHPGTGNHAHGEICPEANLHGGLKPLSSSGYTILTHIGENGSNSAEISLRALPLEEKSLRYDLKCC